MFNTFSSVKKIKTYQRYPIDLQTTAVLASFQTPKASETVPQEPFI